MRVLARLVSGLPVNPVHPAYDVTITGTMPSLYQLIPRTRHRPFVTDGAPERSPGGRICVVRKGPGDGVVLRSSALLDERADGDWEPRLRSLVDWNRLTFIRSGHIRLPEDPVFVDNALFFLFEEPRA